MAKAKIKFLHKPNCTTCRKAKAFLEKKKAELEMRDLGKDRLSVAELDQLIGKRRPSQIPEHAQRTLPHAKNGRESAVARRGPEIDGRRAKLDPPSGRASRDLTSCWATTRKR